MHSYAGGHKNGLGTRPTALARLVFLVVVVYGSWKNGLHFLSPFVPKGVPIYILPLIVCN
jgi:F0F1-type ATP synthase membrane subunit a